MILDTLDSLDTIDTVDILDDTLDILDDTLDRPPSPSVDLKIFDRIQNEQNNFTRCYFEQNLITFLKIYSKPLFIPFK